ncbi:hypothetical protein [Proteus phage vB_PmiP_RS51pmB]|nr:hypothetical protein [Proteus phage vB_PmiP_RS51pmB]
MWFKNKEERAAPEFSCDEVEFISVFAVSMMGGPSKAIDMYNSMSEEKRNKMDLFVKSQLSDALTNNLSLTIMEAAEINLIIMLGIRVITDNSSCSTIMKACIMNGLIHKVESAISIANDTCR